MPGAMHRMGVYLGLVEDDDYAGERRLRRCARPSGAPARRDGALPSGPRCATTGGYDQRTEYGYARRTGRRRYAETARRLRRRPAYQITTLHPRTYNEARTIGEHFRKNTPVIMNLSEMDDADAKRLVDFAAGLTFGLHGRIERVTAKVFLLSPHNVTVTAQDKATHRRERILQPVLSSRTARSHRPDTMEHDGVGPLRMAIRLTGMREDRERRRVR